MKTKLFCMMVLCAGLLVGCDKETEKPEIPENPPVENPEEPEHPEKVPSTDGIIKTKIGDINMIVGTQDWYAVAYGNGKYVVGGGNRDINVYTTTSMDGVNWTSVKQIIGFGDAIKNISGITFGNGKFVACTNNLGAITSTDGINWTNMIRMPLGGNATGIAFGNGKFVVAGNSGYIQTSSDGVNWTSQKVGSTSTYFTCVTFGNGKFVVSGYGISVSSADGITWTSIVTTSNTRILSIVFANGKFVAAGNNDNGSKGQIISSVDGINWENEIIFDIELIDVIYNRGKFIAVGYTSVYSGGKWNYTDYVTTSIDGVNWTTPETLKDESGNVITADLNGICAMP